MNKKPIFGRTLLALVIIVVFAWSTYPLRNRDFFKTFEGVMNINFQEAEKNVSENQKSLDEDKKAKENLEDQLDAALKQNDKKLVKELGPKVEALAKKIEGAQKRVDAVKVIKLANEKLAKSDVKNPPQAIEDAADELKADLTKLVDFPNMVTNRDVLRVVRNKAKGSIKFGLDLNGGTELVVRVVPDKKPVDDKAVKDAKTKVEDEPIKKLRDRVVEILSNRINKSGLVEPEIAPEGEDRISIKVPVANESEKKELIKLIEMSAKLEFRLIHKDNDELLGKYAADPTVPLPIGCEMMKMEKIDAKGRRSYDNCFVETRAQMDGTNITDASVVYDQYGQREIILSFNNAGSKDFGNVTTANVGRRLGIVLDGTLYSAPVIKTAIFGNASISGSFSQEEADRVSTALKCGNLPAKPKIDGMFDVDPTLGKESIRSGKFAVGLSLVAVFIFMFAYYFKAGVIANIALFVNIVLLMGSLASFGATLTLPGIAGIVLTIGMAVDANVLIYERIREELDAHKTLPNAIDLGYKRAFTAIFDSNITTIITAVLLYWYGSGAVKGFAVTLIIGITASMFTAIFLTRLVFDIMLRSPNFKKLKMMRFFSQPNFDFMGIWKKVAYVSLALTLIFVGLAIYKGKSALSVDFTGGTQLILSYNEHVSQDKLSDFCKKSGYDAKLAYKRSVNEGNKLEVVIQKGPADVKKDASGAGQTFVTLLNKEYPNSKFTVVSESELGSLVSSQFAYQAIIAFVLSFIAMTIYLALRFELSYGVAAIIALVHDVVMAAGVLILCDRQLSLTVLAALLTIVGYSVNDTIVTFDRIRENLSLYKNKTYHEIINLSINQTLSRTILTSLTVFLVVIILFLFGGVSINDFALVMLVGVFTGCYSSIYIASPVITLWHKKVIGMKD